MKYDTKQHAAYSGVTWWPHCRDISERVEFKDLPGQLCLALLFEERLVFTGSSDMVGDREILRGFLIGRFGTEWQGGMVPNVENGDYYYLSPQGFKGTRLFSNLPLHIVLRHLAKKANIRGDFFSQGTRGRLWLGTKVALKTVADQLLAQEHRDCHFSLLQTLFRLGVTRQEFEHFAPALARAMDHLRAQNVAELECLDQEEADLRLTFESGMDALTASRKPLLVLKDKFEAWLKL